MIMILETHKLPKPKREEIGNMTIPIKIILQKGGKMKIFLDESEMSKLTAQHMNTLEILMNMHHLEGKLNQIETYLHRNEGGLKW